MDCVTAKTLLDEHIDGLLDREARSALVDHLRSCAECEAEMNRLLRVRSALKSAPRFKAPAGFSSRVIEKIRMGGDASVKEPGLFGWLWSMPAHLKLAEAAAIIMVTVMGVYSAEFLSSRLLNGNGASEQGEASLLALASLDELDTVPPGSMGDMYLSIKENGNEQ